MSTLYMRIRFFMSTLRDTHGTHAAQQRSSVSLSSLSEQCHHKAVIAISGQVGKAQERPHVRDAMGHEVSSDGLGHLRIAAHSSHWVVPCLRTSAERSALATACHRQRSSTSQLAKRRTSNHGHFFFSGSFAACSPISQTSTRSESFPLTAADHERNHFHGSSGAERVALASDPRSAMKTQSMAGQ